MTLEPELLAEAEVRFPALDRASVSFRYAGGDDEMLVYTLVLQYQYFAKMMFNLADTPAALWLLHQVDAATHSLREYAESSNLPCPDITSGRLTLIDDAEPRTSVVYLGQLLKRADGQVAINTHCAEGYEDWYAPMSVLALIQHTAEQLGDSGLLPNVVSGYESMCRTYRDDSRRWLDVESIITVAADALHAAIASMAEERERDDDLASDPPADSASDPLHEAVTQVVRKFGHDHAHAIVRNLHTYTVRWAENMKAFVVADQGKPFVFASVSITPPPGHPSRTPEEFIRLARPVVQHNCELEVDDQGDVVLSTGGAWDAANPYDTALIPYLRAWAFGNALREAVGRYRTRHLAPGDVGRFITDVLEGMQGGGK